MSPPKIGLIVESDGEVTAAPSLIYKILHEINRLDIHVAQPKNSHGCSNLTKEQGIERFVKYAWSEANCAGVIILIDGDTLDDCPVKAAFNLAERVRALNGHKPVAIVVAVQEYESWFLASIESISGQPIDAEISLPADLIYPKNPELLRGVKGWISRQLPSGKSYRETVHQTSMTRLIDLELARSRSRSFKRLCDAVYEILAAIDSQTCKVTPQQEDST